MPASPPLPTVAPATNRIYYPSLDGVRALAFLLVFAYHAGGRSLTTSGLGTSFTDRLASVFYVGNYGLTLFFALSAFLVTKLLLVERERTGTIAPGSFLLRRTLRIWPLYFALLLVVGIGVAAFGQLPGSAPLTGRDFVFLGTFQGDFLRMWGPDTILTPLWSLGVEEKFYVLWPFLLLLVRSRGAVAMMGAGLIVLATAWRLGSGHLSTEVVLFCPLTHADAFGAGILLACLPARAPRAAAERSGFLAGPWPATLGLLGGFLLAGVSQKLALRFGLPKQAFAPGIAAAAAVLFLHVVAPLERGWLASRPMIELGKRSYAAYLFHLILVDLVIWLSPLRSLGGLLAMQLFALAATIALAWLSYRFLETPFLRLKKRFERVASREI